MRQKWKWPLRSTFIIHVRLDIIFSLNEIVDIVKFRFLDLSILMSLTLGFIITS